MIDRLVLRLITRHCAFGFDDAAKMIGLVVGRSLARNMALDGGSSHRSTGWYLDQGESLLQAFQIISATGYLPTAREAMCDACDAELSRMRTGFHQGGRA